MAIEDVGNKILLSPPEMARYIDDFNSPYVAAYFDVGNVIPYGYPEHWILTLGNRIKKMHVKGYSAKTRTSTPDLLSGTIDWPAVMKAIRDVGYDDVLTAELRGVGNTAYDCCKSISEDMDKILEM